MRTGQKKRTLSRRILFEGVARHTHFDIVNGIKRTRDAALKTFALKLVELDVTTISL